MSDAYPAADTAALAAAAADAAAAVRVGTLPDNNDDDVP
tara:strand:- start:681 stop:797 length:117 start_codon:yes stop_codon:yes gene_type:complete